MNIAERLGQEGRAQEQQRSNKAITSMLAKNIPSSLITELTGLSEQELLEIKYSAGKN